MKKASAGWYKLFVPPINPPRFGLNRFDARSIDAFAADVRRAEALGWDAALQPDSQLRRRDC